MINIAGLATGIACVLLAVLYWDDEHSFDLFHANNPNLYRITTTLVETKGENLQTIGGTGQVQGPAFKQAIPEVKDYVRILGGDIFSDVIANEKSIQLRPLFVDSNFFGVFSFPLLRGNPTTALHDMNAAILTETTARKYFNSVDVIGKLLRLDADPSFDKLGKPMVVTGVVKDPPANSSLQFDVLFSFDFLKLSFEDKNWLNAYLGTFVILNPDAYPKEVAKKFDQVYALHAKDQIAETVKVFGYDPQVSYGLQPVTDIHLHPLSRANGNAEGGVINDSDPIYAYLFFGIAAFILLMAVINFINISIAGSLKRSKEVGIRKVSGASRVQIILQFVSESALICLVSFLVSMLLMYVCLPLFNSLTGKQIQLAISARLSAWFVTAFVITVLITAIYPAIIISRFNPSTVLYNRQKLPGKNLFAKGLVVFQFSLAVFLLIATLVYYNQMNFVRTKDLGYNPNEVIRTNINGDRDYRSTITFMKNEIEKESSVASLSFGNDGYPENMEMNGRGLKAIYKNVDENFLSTMQIPLKLGENVSSGPSSANDRALVNEAFVREYRLERPIGTQLRINRDGDSLIKTISGVVKDFHFGSLREPIAPMVMYTRPVPDGGIWVRFDKSNQANGLAALEKVYKEAMPGSVFKYRFLDELNASQYQQELRWQKVVNIATVLSFLICCLGLFGLAHHATERRTREIGIRKVLGASVQQIVQLISADFLKLVFIAFLIAAPLSWLAMNKWLQNFAYRINIGLDIFAATALLATLVALLAVSYQSIKAAMANPVTSLRSEN
jgi:putative ABC transport system permease protein